MSLEAQREPSNAQLREQALQYEASRYDVPQPRYTNLLRAYDLITKAALIHAEATGVTGFDFNANLLQPGIDVINTLLWGVQKDEAPSEEKVKLWHHRQDLLDLVRADKAPHLNKEYIEHATGLYLGLPYRDPRIDRLLVDALVAVETSAYADQMINEPSLFGLVPPRSPLRKRHPLALYLKGQFWNFFWNGVVVAAMVALFNYGYIGGPLAFWVSVGFAFLSVVSLVLATVFLPVLWKSHNKDKKEVAGLIREMVVTYNELQSSGPISARRIMERVSEADQKGVAWPAPLHVLLDDIMARLGRF